MPPCATPHTASLPQRPSRCTLRSAPLLGAVLAAALLSTGCAVVAVADAAVTVVSTTVKVGATVVGTTVDVGAAGVRAVVSKDED